jgi:peptidoglycan hydrolase-like protein with peptidoglycan-binding domain
MEEKIKYVEIAVERAKFLMKYSLNKTLSENTKKGKLLNEVSSPIEEAIKTVESMGFTSRNIGTTYTDCKSGNQVFAKAALYGLKKITDTQINRSAIGNYDCLTVKVSSIDGNAPKPYTIKNFSTSSGIKQKLNGKVAELITNKISIESNVSVGSLFFLESFYFEWAKIINDYKESFKNNKDAYKSTLFPDGWLNFFNYWYGTSMFDEALNSVRNSEKFRCNGGKSVINTTYGDPWQEANLKDAVGVLHFLLPLGSFLISVMFPPSWIALGAAALLELGDAALYLTVDKDPYAAGLSAIFAFIPFAQLKFMPFVYRLGKTKIANLIQKLVYKKGSLLDEELEALKELSKNLGRLEKMSKLNMVKKLTLLSIRSIKSVSKLIKFLGKLINRGLLNHESLGQSGLWIAGSFITWDKIAKINGICNTMPLSALKQADWKILKKIGYAGEYLQPYSDPCDLQKGVELLGKYNATNIIEEILKQDIENKIVYSLDYSDVKTLSVELIQKVLIAGGFNKNLSSENPTWSYMFNKINVSNAKEIKKITIYNKKGIFVKKFENTPQKSSINFDVSGLQKGDYNIVFEKNDGTKYESKFTYGGQSLNTPIKIKRPTDMEIGYYDEATYLSVKKYQKSKGLTDDGLAGKNTIESILSDFKNHKYGLSVDKLNEMNLDEMRIKKIQKEFEEWSSDTETKFLSGQYSIEKVQEAYDKDKKRNEELGNLIYNSMINTEAENANEEDLEVISEPFNENN